MNTRHAQIVLTIVRFGSITAAAKALYITQPMLSQTLKQIETPARRTHLCARAQPHGAHPRGRTVRTGRAPHPAD